MTTKKKAPPKKKAVKKKVVKKHAVKKKAPVRKKAASASKQPASVSKGRATPATRTKKTNAKRKKAPAKRVAAKKSVVKKPRARARRLGPVPKYHLDHKSWDKPAVMMAICEELTSSSKGIAYICRDNDDFPCIAIVFRWFNKETMAGGDQPLVDMYARAKQIQIDFLADETIEIADNETAVPIIIDDVPIVINGEVIKTVTPASVQHAKLRCENRRWIAEKLAHRKYGNKLEVSSDPERPLSTVSDEDLDARIALLQKKADELKPG